MRRLTLYDLAVVTLVMIFSFIPFMQPRDSWNGYGSLGSHFYKNDIYEIHYSDHSSGIGKPEIYLANEYARTPLIEFSDHTSKVDGITLHPAFESRVKINGTALRATYSGNGMTLTKSIEVSKEVRISYRFERSVNFTLALWRWYYEEVRGVTKYNWKISKIEPVGELDFTFQSAGGLCAAKLLAHPKPEEILVEGDTLGINKIVLNFNSKTIDLRVKADPKCFIGPIVSPFSTVVYPVTAGVVSTMYLGINCYMHKLRIRSKPINIRGASSLQGFLRKPTTITVIGSGIRLALAPFFMHAWDISTVQESLEYFLSGRNVYASVVEKTEMLRQVNGVNANYEGYAYLPHPLLIYAPFYILYKLVTDGSPPIINGHLNGPIELVQPNIYLFLMLIKIPIIVADAAIIYLLAKRSFRTGMMYALLPYSILITSMWGHFDPLIGLLLMLTAVTISRRPLLAGILFGTAIMKIFVVVALPFILLSLFKRGKSCAMFLTGLILSQIPTLLFLAQDYEAMLNVLLFHATRSPGGLNIFNLAPKLYSYGLQSIVNKLALLMLGASVLAVTLSLRRDAHTSIILPIAAYMVFGPVTNEQHLAALIPLLLYTRHYFITLLLSFSYLGYALLYSGPTYFTTPLAKISGPFNSFLQNLGQSWAVLFGDITSQLLYMIAVFSALTTVVHIKSAFQGVGPESSVQA